MKDIFDKATEDAFNKVFVNSGNQCDGCVAGIPKDHLSMHRNEHGTPLMLCQSDKYKGSKND